MTRSEIQQTLQSNVDRVVEITWDDDTCQMVKVINVDDEGFVNELVPADANKFYWASDNIVKISLVRSPD